MSGAQAVTSGVPAASGGVRPASSDTSDRGDQSFRDALETASRSGNGQETGRARRDKGSGDHGPNEQEKVGANGSDRLREDGSGATDLAQMLVELGFGALAIAETENGSSAQQPARTSGMTPDASDEIWLPGAVQDGENVLDAEQLNALLKSGAAGLPDAEQDPFTIKAKVMRQETHLALGRAPSAASLEAKLSGGDAVDIMASAAQAIDDSHAVRRGATDAQGNAAGSSRANTIAEDWGRGAAFAEAGVGGQDGRQSEGRGSSGTGGQQQGSGAFVAMLANGASRAAGTVDAAGDLGFAQDPVSEQIADHVRGELKAGVSGDGSSDGAVKVLELELKPANLGAVTVRLALKDNVISIHIEAQRAETLAVIEREREALSSALASAGYSVDGITAAPQSDMNRQAVSVVAQADGGSSASHGGSQGQFGQGQEPGNSAGGQGRSGSAGNGASTYQTTSGDKDNGGAGIRREAGGIYV